MSGLSVARIWAKIFSFIFCFCFCFFSFSFDLFLWQEIYCVFSWISNVNSSTSIWLLVHRYNWSPWVALLLEMLLLHYLWHACIRSRMYEVPGTLMTGLNDDFKSSGKTLLWVITIQNWRIPDPCTITSDISMPIFPRCSFIWWRSEDRQWRWARVQCPLTVS